MISKKYYIVIYPIAAFMLMGFAAFASAQEDSATGEPAATTETVETADTANEIPVTETVENNETAQAEEATTAAEEAKVEELVNLDEAIAPKDLGVGDPKILPGNPLYVFKGIGRGVQSLVTFDPTKEAELKLRFANEKIIEAQKLEENGAGDNRMKNAVESYKHDVEKARKYIDQASAKGTDDIEHITDRVIDNQITHSKLLGKFMKEHEDVAPEIEQAKQEAMRQFAESSAATHTPEKLRQKFEEALKNQKGSAFRHFKNVEVLEEVKDFVPEAAKAAIQHAIEQSSKSFEEDFADIEDDQRKLFNKYLERTGGNEVRHLEAFDSINSFADIQKDFAQDIERAREKARERVESRMKSIGDETRKQVFVAHLEDGDFEDARIVKELENNLAPETVATILDIKHKSDQKIRERFEQAETSGDLQSFFKEIEQSPDVRMMEIMQEMETIIPADKKEFFDEMKKKAMTEMQAQIEKARSFGRLEDQLQQMAGFDPEQMQVIESFEGEFGTQFTFFDEMREEQSGRIKERFENLREFSAESPETESFLRKGEEFRLRIEEDPAVRTQIESFAPSITEEFSKFDTAKAEGEISQEALQAKMQEADKLVQELSRKLIQTEDSNPGLEAARQLYSNASASVADATAAFTQNKTGEAFGKTTSAIHLAGNGLRKLEKAAYETERKDYFEKRDEFRDKFKDLPRAERPDPSKFIEFKSKSFPAFEISQPQQQFREKVNFERKGEQRICAQVITPARHIESGKCTVFPDSCVPEGWERVAECQTNESFAPEFEEKFRQMIKEPRHEREEKMRLEKEEKNIKARGEEGRVGDEEERKPFRVIPNFFRGENIQKEGEERSESHDIKPEITPPLRRQPLNEGLPLQNEREVFPVKELVPPASTSQEKVIEQTQIIQKQFEQIRQESFQGTTELQKETVSPTP